MASKIVYPEVSEAFLDELCGFGSASPELRDVFRKVKLSITEIMKDPPLKKPETTATAIAIRSKEIAAMKDSRTKDDAEKKIIAGIQALMGGSAGGATTTSTTTAAESMTTEKIDAAMRSMVALRNKERDESLNFVPRDFVPPKREPEKEPEPTFAERQAKDPLWGTF